MTFWLFSIEEDNSTPTFGVAAELITATARRTAL